MMVLPKVEIERLLLKKLYVTKIHFGSLATDEYYQQKKGAT